MLSCHTLRTMRIFLPMFLLLAASFSRTAFAADFTVTNTNATGAGSLAQAINDANSNGGPDRIVFAIPGPGIQRIDLASNRLPDVTDTVVIDGYTQPGASPNTLAVGDNAVILIQLDGGPSATPVSGLSIWASHSIVRGLSMTGFSTAIGTLSDAYDCTVEGNFLGVLPDGKTARGNGTGVLSGGSRSGIGSTITIGGSAPSARNIISGHTRYAVDVEANAVVAGNYIGTDASGTQAIRNEVGVFAFGNLGSTVIGGRPAGSGNVISGNGTAILMGAMSGSIGWVPPHGLPTNYVTIGGNLIGVQSDGATPLGNTSAITILYGSGNRIGGYSQEEGNVIAYNGSAITISYMFNTYSYSNLVLVNSIYSNGGLSIDLASNGRTENDVGDVDDGPNALQNYPIILSRSVSGSTTTVAGTLNSRPNARYAIQLFGDATNKPQTYLGQTNVSSDANGSAAFTMTLPAADPTMRFSATATDSSGNTSESSGDPARLKNISTRAKVQPGDDALIAGFIVREGGSHLVVRAIGPSMFSQESSSVPTLADPTLELYNSAGIRIAQNDNWKDDPATADSLQRAKLAPGNDLESAIDTQLPGGQYTAIVRGKSNGSGLALVEVYQLSEALAGEIANLSTRGRVGTNDEVMIGGFISGEATETSRTLVRALGPSLSAAGVPNTLQDPMLELHDANGATIAANDNWKDKQQAELRATDLPPQDDSEAAIVIRLRPGAYTAIVRGQGNTTGVALVEVYNLH